MVSAPSSGSAPATSQSGPLGECGGFRPQTWHSSRSVARRWRRESSWSYNGRPPPPTGQIPRPRATNTPSGVRSWTPSSSYPIPPPPGATTTGSARTGAPDHGVTHGTTRPRNHEREDTSVIGTSAPAQLARHRPRRERGGVFRADVHHQPRSAGTLYVPDLHRRRRHTTTHTTERNERWRKRDKKALHRHHNRPLNTRFARLPRERREPPCGKGTGSTSRRKAGSYMRQISSLEGWSVEPWWTLCCDTHGAVLIVAPRPGRGSQTSTCDATGVEQPSRVRRSQFDGRHQRSPRACRPTSGSIRTASRPTETFIRHGTQ